MEPSPYAEQRYKDGLDYARRATHYDQAGNYSEALCFYNEAVEALTHATYLAPTFTPILTQVEEYSKRMSAIREYLVSGVRQQGLGRQLSDGQVLRDKKILQQVQYLLNIALQDDEKGKSADASKMYTCAIELAIQAQKKMQSDEQRQQVKTVTMQALSRLEQLKLEASTSKKADLLSEIDDLPLPPTAAPKPLKNTGASRSATVPRVPLTSFLDSDGDLTRAPQFTAYSDNKSPGVSRSADSLSSRHQHATVGGKPHKGARFSDFELKILRATSTINGVTYLPWSDADLVELRKVSAIAQDFEDPNGLLRLSDKQRAQISGWQRPYELSEEPKMINLISSLSIKQTLIGDCSFVASLTVSADYERKFKTRLVTRLIYPQNSSGEPVMNPNGKYFVSFNLNGCRRRIVIDDRLPVGRSGELLCSYSSNADEFWVSLIEKAYMKVMGGYDFPGSSSNIDLHALTGWIPERLNLKKGDDAMFRKMEQGLRKGNALLTIATGELSEGKAERAGLVPTHAYAILNAVDVHGVKLLQLKNPWSHRRWKGNYSEKDNVHWTPELKKALHFDQMRAMQYDNGVFWIDWTSVLSFYDVAYINWKPDIFKHKSTIHDCWKPTAAEKDWYDISSNPQYCLKVMCKDPLATVWILLSRHITTKSDFANNEKFITLNIDASDGKRIYYNNGSKFLLQGIKINTPHYLAKLEGVTRGTSTYTVIVSQLESLSTIYYTLKVYSTCEFNISQVPNPYLHHQQLKGGWRNGQAAQPRFLVTTSAVANQVLVKLRAPKELFAQIDIQQNEASGSSFQRINSGLYRQGLVVLETSLPKGEFVVSALCYNPKDIPVSATAAFLITLYSDTVFNFNVL